MLQQLWRERCKWLLRISQQIYMEKMTYGKKIDLFPQLQVASFLRLFISNLILKALGAIICSGAWHSRSNYLNQFNFWWLTHQVKSVCPLLYLLKKKKKEGRGVFKLATCHWHIILAPEEISIKNKQPLTFVTFHSNTGKETLHERRALLHLKCIA